MKTLISLFLLIPGIFAPVASYSIELSGVGRRIPASIFSDWNEHYNAKYPGTSVKYLAFNATEGIKRVEQGTADFGETDNPLSLDELHKRGLAQFPYMFSAITPIINLPGIYDGQLNLTGKILGDIFLGKITKWNDSAIVALNDKLTLPNEKILVAHRSADGGGTYTFSSYLSKSNPQWAANVGSGVILKWPVGTAVDNLYAMGEYIKNTPNSIGYSEIAYSRKNLLTYVRLQNIAGKFVSPHTGSIDEALQNLEWKASNGFNESLIDRPGTGSWPMTSASYIVVRKTSDDIERRQALLHFLGWGLRLGDMDVTRLDFMPINRKLLLPQVRNSWNDTPLSIEGATVVTATEVKSLIAKGVPIIDARVSSEYETAHIPTAKSVPYKEKSAKSVDFNPQSDKFDLAKLPTNKKAEIVFYCNAGACWKGYKAAVAAINAGYKNVLWMRGGLPEWVEKSYPTESSFP